MNVKKCALTLLFYLLQCPTRHKKSTFYAIQSLIDLFNLAKETEAIGAKLRPKNESVKRWTGVK